MKHKKTQRTRKQNALRRGIVFAVFLGLALHFHLFCLTPMQTIRATEFRMGLEPTEIVLSKDNLYLSESENVLMLSDHRPRLNVLFLPPPVAVMDKSHSPPIVAGGYFLADYRNNQMTVHLVGEVFLEGAASVRVYHKDELQPFLRAVELTAEVFTAENGNRYFWSVTRFELDKDTPIPFNLDVLDENGAVLYTCNMLDTWAGESIQ